MVALHEQTEGKGASQCLESDVLMCPMMPNKEVPCLPVRMMHFSMPIQTLVGALDEDITLFCFETCAKPHEGF